MDLHECMETIRRGIGRDGVWKLKLTLEAAVRRGSASPLPEDIGRADACAFGQWLTAVAPQMANDPDFARIRAMHRAFHAEAGTLARMIRDGRGDRALGEIEPGGRFARTATALVSAMAEWRLALLDRDHGCARAH